MDKETKVFIFVKKNMAIITIESSLEIIDRLLQNEKEVYSLYSKSKETKKEASNSKQLIDILEDRKKRLELELEQESMANTENVENFVTFDAETLLRFKKFYKEAIRKEEEIFIFDGKEYLVTYAKYLIQYLESKLA